MSLDDWRHVTAVNLDGVFLTFRAAVAHMLERGGGGSLVATSSLTAIEAAPMFEHYAASKAGVIGLVRSLAVELARHRIRANVLMPGWIETELTRPFLESEAAAHMFFRECPRDGSALPGSLRGRGLSRCAWLELPHRGRADHRRRVPAVLSFSVDGSSLTSSARHP